MLSPDTTSLRERYWYYLVIAVAFLSLQVQAGEAPVSPDANDTNAHLQAAGEPEPDNNGLTGDQGEVIEEITVTGQRLISTLRIEVIRAEDRAFDLFNAYNDDNQYDIHCRMEAPTGTRIRYRQCAPNFYVKAEADLTQIMLNGGFMDNRPMLRNKYKELKDEMMKQVLTHPELLEAFLHAQELRKKLGYTIDSYWDRRGTTP